jgi:PAP2 superfamily
MRSLTVTGPLELGSILRRHLLLAAMVLSYFAASVWLSHSQQVNVSDDKAWTLFRSFLIMVPQMVFFVIFWRLLVLTYVERAPDRFSMLKREILAVVSDRERLFGAAITILLMTLMLIAFAQMKNLIPVLNPFSWDIAFMELDRDLHLGWLPHEVLYPVFGGHYVISFFTGIYNVWLFLMYMVLLVACFIRPESFARMQYLIAFVLTWAIGGNLIAGYFSSAGPVYFAELGLGDAYAGLMARLHEHAATGALSVVDTQALLWRFHTMDSSVNAISAFPSMHVASSTLMAIFAFQFSRTAGIVMTLFAIGIQIGSVLLAWHYAVDGYVGAVIAVLCWVAAGILVRRFGGFPVAAR